MSFFFSGRVKKLVVYFGVYESSLDFQRREDQLNTAYCGGHKNNFRLQFRNYFNENKSEAENEK